MNVAHIVPHYFRNIVAVAVCLIAALGAVSAQTESMLLVEGTIKDEDSGRKLPGCVVVVFQDGSEFDRLEVDNNAGYSFELPLRHLYTFQFVRDGFTSKKVSLDVSDVPETDAVDGFGFDLDMTLFKTIEGFDESILDTPIGMGTYDVESGKFNFDMEHTNRVKQRIENEKNRILSIEENRSKNKRAYDVAMKQGENAMKKKNWQEALGFFEEALVLIPDEEEAIEERDKARRELDAISADLSEQQAEEDAARAAKEAEAAALEAKRLAQEEDARQRKADADARNAQSNQAAADADAAANAAADADAAATAAANAAANADADAAANAAAADAANAAAAQGEAADQKAAEDLARQTQIDYDAAQAEIEAANERDAEEAEEAERKRAALLANTANKEPDEAEKYYRDALKSESKARSDELAARVQAESDLLKRRKEEAKQRSQGELDEMISGYRNVDNSVDYVEPVYRNYEHSVTYDAPVYRDIDNAVTYEAPVYIETHGIPTISESDMDLPQGFYESSYKIQNGIVIERTIRDGDHILRYRKVVMKTGTYYFKQRQSITSTVWHRETTLVYD
ncbi:MAG: hypothetical protein O3A35_00390 [Bacteroidetes bacterium]|nr:hypothetical protein [Bacteroidota bacterium]